MNRRQLLKRMAGVALVVSPVFSRILRAQGAFSKPREPKYVFIRDSAATFNEETLLDRADVALAARDPKWRDELVTWELRTNQEEIRNFLAKYGPNTKTFSWPVLVSVPQVETFMVPPDVELWTPEWLAHSDSRFQKACYPVSNANGWWSVEGDWNPSLEKVRDHLFTSPNHVSGHFQLPWLSLLKFGELQSLHSDHHEEMINEGQVTWKDVNAECPA